MRSTWSSIWRPIAYSISATVLPDLHSSSASCQPHRRRASTAGSWLAPSVNFVSAALILASSHAYPARALRRAGNPNASGTRPRALGVRQSGDERGIAGLQRTASEHALRSFARAECGITRALSRSETIVRCRCAHREPRPRTAAAQRRTAAAPREPELGRPGARASWPSSLTSLMPTCWSISAAKRSR